jgi:hypothetical protein
MRTLLIVSALSLVLGGCANTGQLATDTEVIDFAMDTESFHREGLGFLTPVSATGQEADRVALAIAFADAVDASCDELHVVRLAEVLSAVNQSGLAADYKQMVDDYEATGILERNALQKVGEASGARYLGLLSLGRFSQQTNKRFSIGGMRIFDTKQASIRLSLQIWDSQAGSIVWEGSDEIHYAYDTGKEKPVNLSFVAAKAADNLISSIPEPDVSDDGSTAVAAR